MLRREKMPSATEFTCSRFWVFGLGMVMMVVFFSNSLKDDKA